MPWHKRQCNRTAQRRQPEHHRRRANDYLIYNTTTGALYFDADGNGAGLAVQIALLGSATHPVIANTDFLMV